MKLRRLFLCSTILAVFRAGVLQADDWPQWLGPNRDAVWRENGIVEKFPAGGPPILWRAAVGGGYSGPAVAHGRVYLSDRQLPDGGTNPKDPFQRSVIRGSERVLCFNEADGKLVWKYDYDCPYTISYPAGPRATPLIADGKVFSLGAEGNLFCLDATNGKVLWSHDFKKDYGAQTPMWGFAAHPLLDGNRLICLVGGEGSTAVAFDKDTGKEIWKNLSIKDPGYAPPMIYEGGGKRQLIIWHPDSVNSLEPETGKLYWSAPWKARMNLTISTPRKLEDWLFFTSFYSGSLMLHLDSSKPSATVAWKTEKPSEKDTTHLNAIMCTPFLEDGYIYGVCSYGQLRCL